MFKLWKKIKFVLQDSVTPEQLNKMAELAKTMLLTGQQGIDEKYIHGPEAEAALKLAQAAAKLIETLKHFDNAALRVGPLLILKLTENSKPTLMVETISPALRKALDERPELLRDPLKLRDELKSNGALSASTTK